MLNNDAWLVIVGGLVAGSLVLLRFWRGARRRAIELEGELDGLAGERDVLRQDLSKETQTRKRFAEEISTFRKRADKTKRRQSKTPDVPLGTAARIGEIEAELTRVGMERNRAIAENATLVQTVAGLETRLADAQSELNAAVAVDSSVPSATPASPTTPPTTPTPPPAPSTAIESKDASDLETAQREMAASVERVTKLESELDVGRKNEARMRKRMSNQEQLYASLRSELDVKKDRLRTQEEQIQRLQALKVAIID